MPSVIDKIIQTKSAPLTKKDAKDILQKCGVLDEDGNLRPEFEGILTYTGGNVDE